MSPFEASMLVCFGISWPISITKSLVTKKTEGKSVPYMLILCVGYGFGIVHKLFYSYDWIMWLYAVNIMLVCIDIYLYYKFLPKSDLCKKKNIK